MHSPPAKPSYRAAQAPEIVPLPDPPCRVPGCIKTVPVQSGRYAVLDGSKTVDRGLCSWHKNHFYKLVRSGQTTWAQLERDGLLGEASRSMPPVHREKPETPRQGGKALRQRSFNAPDFLPKKIKLAMAKRREALKRHGWNPVNCPRHLFEIPAREIPLNK